MRKLYFIKIVLLLIASLAAHSCNDGSKQNAINESQNNWEAHLGAEIGLLGHRNWIVVVDAAYPLQSNPGITTIHSDRGHVETIKKVSAMIDAQSHITPIVYLDKEIDFVNESDASGIAEFRESLAQIIDVNFSKKILHEDIISMLDEASNLFNIVIIKTDFTLPYTSVFFQLDCKYWNATAEHEMRKRMSDNTK